jgi:hypothetical protein
MNAAIRLPVEQAYAELVEQVLSDPARGTRRLWCDADGTPVRLELAAVVMIP